MTGVPHHLLGTISPSIEFTAKDFRDSAIPVRPLFPVISILCISGITEGKKKYTGLLECPWALDDVVLIFQVTIKAASSIMALMILSLLEIGKYGVAFA